MISNKSWFQKGQVSLNRGRTLESWVGEERAKQIRQKMSLSSKKKAAFLRSLNKNKQFLAKRRVSRKYHEQVVKDTVEALRAKGKRCFILSEYVREKRIPDAIILTRGKLVALEVEQEKKYKPTRWTLIQRLTRLNELSDFFDETKVVFVPRDADHKSLIKSFVSELA